jgi:hypothetical protein
MTLTPLDQKALWGEAGGVCSFIGLDGEPCRAALVMPATTNAPTAILGENAHIEGEKVSAARHRASMTEDERAAYANHILLCPSHHTTIDKPGQEQTYTVERLRGMKETHESWVRTRLRPSLVRPTPQTSYVTETVHASLLEVEQAPSRLFRIATIDKPFWDIRERIAARPHGVFLLRRGLLYSFWDPRLKESGFDAVTTGEVTTLAADACWKDENLERFYAELLNQTASRFLEGRGLVMEQHGRAFFPLVTPGEAREERYVTVAGTHTTRKVAWSPITRKTGKPKSYWIHRAVRLRFLRVRESQFVASLRPEFHLTTDGRTPYPAERVGALVTRRKAKMWNYQLLQEVRFWTSYLGEQAPRVVIPTAGQTLAISCNLLRASVTWPGVAGDDKVFKKPDFQEDLFSAADLRVAQEEEEHWIELFGEDDGEDEL